MAGVKPSAISSATVAAFKTKLGYLTQEEADLRYPQISEGEPVDLDALLAEKADLASPTFTGTPLVPTAAAGTNTTQVVNAEFINQQNNEFTQNLIDLGLTDVKITPMMAYSLSATGETLTDGRGTYQKFKNPRTQTVNGVGFIQSTQGAYTGDNYNGFVLYSVSGNAYTEITRTVNNADVWKGTANSLVKVAFPSPVVLNAGIYVVGSIYNNSAQTTAPVIAHFGVTTTANIFGGATFKISGRTESLTDLPSSIANESSLIQLGIIKGIILY